MEKESGFIEKHDEINYMVSEKKDVVTGVTPLTRMMG